MAEAIQAVGLDPAPLPDLAAAAAARESEAAAGVAPAQPSQPSTPAKAAEQAEPPTAHDAKELESAREELDRLRQAEGELRKKLEDAESRASTAEAATKAAAEAAKAAEKAAPSPMGGRLPPLGKPGDDGSAAAAAASEAEGLRKRVAELEKELLGERRSADTLSSRSCLECIPIVLRLVSVCSPKLRAAGGGTRRPGLGSRGALAGGGGGGVKRVFAGRGSCESALGKAPRCKNPLYSR